MGNFTSIKQEPCGSQDLDRLAPKLWLAVRGRSIVQTENPQLHLVWYYDRIFIKPIPRYLLSFAFWQYLGAEPAATRKAAIGFMRSYSHLIQYESDFSLALEKGLIPRRSPCGPSTATGKDDITFESFVRLITSFDRFDDAHVSPRYSYGELRLTRLNFYSRIFLGKLTFHHINAQWGTFINGAITPFVVVFAILAIVLNAMQVELAVPGYNDLSSSWAAFANASKWAAVIVLIFVLLTIVFIVILVLFMFCHDIWFARSILRDKKNQTHATSWATRKSGVV
ncbi:hypothetical protein G7Y79_00002g007960 [Physcia stellaris]|nr:hypothetical protein G7Y79_00002g007960 [Physcia stellaris]